MVLAYMLQTARCGSEGCTNYHRRNPEILRRPTSCVLVHRIFRL